MKQICILLIAILFLIKPSIIFGQSDFFAYHTEINSSPIFGEYSDIVVNLEFGEFIFQSNQSFRPYWQNTSNLVPYLGPVNPDSIAEYSYARLISQDSSEIIVHWRYPTTTSKVAMGFETYVHELYTIRPDGSITRIVKQGTSRIEDWEYIGNQWTQEIQLSSGTMSINSTMNPSLRPRPLPAKKGNVVLGPAIGSPTNHWKFDEALNDYNDATTKDNVTNTDCPINGYQANYKEGVSGTSLAFDGYFSEVELPKAQAPNITGNITLEAWVALSANPHNMVPLVHQSSFGLHPNIGEGDEEKYTPFQGGNGYYLGINFEGQPSFVVSIDGSLQYCTAPSGTITTKKWAYVAAVKNDDQLILYVNGEQVATKSVLNSNISTADTDVLIGKNNIRMKGADAGGQGNPLTDEVNFFGVEGLIDEVKIYNTALSGSQIFSSYNNFMPESTIIDNPEIQARILPGDTTIGEEFNVGYTKLTYHDIWDNMWQTSDYSDVLVKFENVPTSIAFWRGMNYGFATISDNNIWNASQSLENYHDKGCYEHMMDRECRTSHVRIIENTPARVLVHWRYSPRAADYSIYPSIGNSYWADEYYYIFPDQCMVRKVVWHSTDDHPFHDNNLIISPEKTVSDLINTSDVVYFANDKGETGSINYPNAGDPGISNASIKLINTKSNYKPFNLYPGSAYHTSITAFDGPFSHWPVAQANSDGLGGYFDDTKPRVRSLSLGANDNMITGGSTATCFWGLTNQSVGSLVNLRRSWNSAPDIENIIGGDNNGYDIFSRSYYITKIDDIISFEIDANNTNPISNLCFVINNWNSSDLANLSINYVETTDFEQGFIYDTDGLQSLVIFVPLKSSSLTEFTISNSLPSDNEVYTLSTEIFGNGSNSLNIEPKGPVYESETEVTITAVPTEGYRFTSWSGDVEGSENPVKIIMDDNKTIAALFSELDDGLNNAFEVVDSQILIYPNPVLDGNLIISFGDREYGDVQLNISNADGKMLINDKRIVHPNDLINYNVSKFNKGLFVLKISSEQINFIQSFIIK